MSKSPRLGRPPKVLPDDIARAALKIGLDKATVRAVADALGMSVPGLYHHVRTREELFELAADYWFRMMVEGAPANGAFLDHLLHFARRQYEQLSAHPQIVDNVAAGRFTLTAEGAAFQIRLIRQGVACGLNASEAYDVVLRVMGAAIGAAMIEASERAQADQGNRFLDKVRSALPDDEPELRDFLATEGAIRRGHFDTVLLVVEALKARYGDRLAAPPAD